jgi:hypothetical protein
MDGMLKDDPLGDLEVNEFNGKTLLVQISDKELVAAHGQSRYSCFHRASKIPDR